MSTYTIVSVVSVGSDLTVTIEGPGGPYVATSSFSTVLTNITWDLNTIFTDGGLGEFSPVLPVLGTDDTICNTSGITITILNNSHEIMLNHNMASTYSTTTGFGSPFVCCLHPDSIVDCLGIPISEVVDYPDNDFVQVLKLGYTNSFIRIKAHALSQNIPSEDLLMTG